jgi:hypothetical protein
VDKFYALLNAITQNYDSKNPYHNFEHAFDVCQTVYYILKKVFPSPTETLSKMEILVLLLGCLAHDLNHPGLTNGFQVAAMVRYADQ